MDDLISRQAAIAHAVPLNLFGREVMMVSVSELENLPSAQPEITRCKDCKHYNGEDRDICCPLADYAQSKCGADWFCADAERRNR